MTAAKSFAWLLTWVEVTVIGMVLMVVWDWWRTRREVDGDGAA